MKFLKEVEAARKNKLLRQSLCREGPKAQEWCLWKPSGFESSFGCNASARGNAHAL